MSGQIKKDSLSLVSGIYRNQVKLGKLLGRLESQSNKKQDAFGRAQNSANKDSTAAERSSDNPDSKKLARKAKNTANGARKDSMNATIESANLDKLHKDIQYLKKRIESDQTKLNKMISSKSNSLTIDKIQN
ncbi:hypothetical protein A4D02_19840 [Niastella koreensis]|uniref:Uncharacterized protein n=3 Tax=Niastella koreensis TaxID=354356 RepID=G8TIR7_NIAKG|nr:hypothetical protein Niako_0009 [Niastella koreensis GR20-10]OQP53947.1 hypothetical protein A4D02_19840 [Niastella koreensis]